MTKDFSELAKSIFKSLMAQAEEDARHLEFKAKTARQHITTLKKLEPELLKMLEPLKPFKPVKMTKKRLAEIRKQFPSYPGVTVAYPEAPVTNH